MATTTTEIKAVSTDEQNVSDRTVTYDVYINGAYDTTFDDVLEAMEYVAGLNYLTTLLRFVAAKHDWQS